MADTLKTETDWSLHNLGDASIDKRVGRQSIRKWIEYQEGDTPTEGIQLGRRKVRECTLEGNENMKRRNRNNQFNRTDDVFCMPPAVYLHLPNNQTYLVHDLACVIWLFTCEASYTCNKLHIENVFANIF